MKRWRTPGPLPFSRRSLPCMKRTGKSRVLVVEDNIIVQHATAYTVGALGHEVETAGDGVEAVAICQATRFDVILMDAMMPRMDGFEASRRIRETSGHQKGTARIVMITALSAFDLCERCAAAGIDFWLSKPVAREDIAHALRLASLGYSAPRRSPIANGSV
jgi:CheY-like chemotaxis protein